MFQFITEDDFVLFTDEKLVNSLKAGSISLESLIYDNYEVYDGVEYYDALYGYRISKSIVILYMSSKEEAEASGFHRVR